MTDKPKCKAITKRTNRPCPNYAEWKRGEYCHIHDEYGRNQINSQKETNK